MDNVITNRISVLLEPAQTLISSLPAALPDALPDTRTHTHTLPLNCSLAVTIPHCLCVCLSLSLSLCLSLSLSHGPPLLWCADSQRSHLSSFTMKLMDKFHSPKIKRTPSKKGKQLQPEPAVKSTEKPVNKVCACVRAAGGSTLPLSPVDLFLHFVFCICVCACAHACVCICVFVSCGLSSRRRTKYKSVETPPPRAARGSQSAEWGSIPDPGH